MIDANDTTTLIMNDDQEVVAISACGGGAGSELSLLALGVLRAAVAVRKR